MDISTNYQSLRGSIADIKFAPVKQITLRIGQIYKNILYFWNNLIIR